jgi:hypothetical protein
MRKHQTNSNARYMADTHQNCQGDGKQGKFQKLSQARGTYENLMRRCNVVSWMGSWNGKRHLIKKVI